MEKVYIVKDGDHALHFSSEERMKAAGFNKADKIITAEEFAKNGGYVRIIDGKIIIGHTTEEVEIAECEKTETEMQEQLNRTDYKVIQAAEKGEILSEINPKLAEDRALWRKKINEARNRLKKLGAR